MTSSGSWSTGTHLPTAGIVDRDSGHAWLWQVEHNGAWRWEVGERRDGVYLALLGPTDIDHQWHQSLQPGESFTTVPVSVAVSESGLDGAVAALTARQQPFQRLTAFAELCATEWDRGNEFFPPTTFQISNIHAGTGATNVIPGHLDALFNFRYCTATDEQQLRTRVSEVLERHGLKYRIQWTHSGAPFLTEPGTLSEAARAAVRDVCGIEPQLSTSGGTSDGRFIAPTGAQVIELGPVNATIHKVDECVRIEDLDRLSRVVARGTTPQKRDEAVLERGPPIVPRGRKAEAQRREARAERAVSIARARGVAAAVGRRTARGRWGGGGRHPRGRGALERGVGRGRAAGRRRGEGLHRAGAGRRAGRPGARARGHRGRAAARTRGRSAQTSARHRPPLCPRPLCL